MIAIVASDLDPEARSLAVEWRSAGAALLSAVDVCSAGWQMRVGDVASGTAVVAGRIVRTADIRGVLVRRPAVLAEELTCIDRRDRSYVAAEVNAFLVAWLHALNCPVVNRPGARSLCGPAWNRLQWKAACARERITWVDTDDTDDADVRDVVVCGDRTLFAKTRAQTRAARHLARITNATLLGVRFRGDAVAGVSGTPSLGAEEVRAALLPVLSSDA